AMESRRSASGSVRVLPWCWRHEMSELETSAREQRKLYVPVAGTPTSYAREEPDAHPPMDFAAYKSTALRHPKQALVYLPHTLTEVTGPQLGSERFTGELDNDLTRQHD